MTLKINNRYKDLAQLRHRAKHLKFVTGERHAYLGKKYRLKVKVGEHNKVELKKTIIVVTCRKAPTQKRVKRIMHGWYLEKAKVLFPKMMARAWKQFNYRGHKMPKLRIRHMKTCWATISLLTHRITLNTDLIKVPRGCIHYVIIHEFCHLRSIYHDKKFYDFLRKKEPHWHKRRDQLDHLRI